MSTPQFKDSVHKSFIKTGCIAHPVTKKFAVYSSASHNVYGELKFEPSNAFKKRPVQPTPPSQPSTQSTQNSVDSMEVNYDSEEEDDAAAEEEFVDMNDEQFDQYTHSLVNGFLDSVRENDGILTRNDPATRFSMDDPEEDEKEEVVYEDIME